MTDVAPDPVLVDVADRIAVVTLNRPGRRNAISSALARSLVEAMAELEADPSVDVIVLTGSGPAFCAGLDLDELGDAGTNLFPGGSDTGPWAPGGGTWHPITKPVIGAINGPAVTGGLELALQCDLLIAGSSARFGDTHGRIGVFPGGGMIALLPRLVGRQAALRMSLTGDFIDADEAYRLGLVVLVVDDHELLGAARALASDIASSDQALVRSILDSYRRLDGLSREDALAEEARIALDRHRSLDLGVVRDRRDGVIARGRAR